MKRLARILLRLFVDAPANLFGLCMMILGVVVLACGAVHSGIRALELWAFYDGDELARDRDDWKYR